MDWVCVVYGGGEINAYRVWMGKPQGNRSLAGPRCKWEDDINMDLKG